jgi:hypothetical protein
VYVCVWTVFCVSVVAVEVRIGVRTGETIREIERIESDIEMTDIHTSQ